MFDLLSGSRSPAKLTHKVNYHSCKRHMASSLLFQITFFWESQLPCYEDTQAAL